MSAAHTFLAWCVRQGLADPAMVDEATGSDSPLRSVRRTYGKVQDRHPARWLDRSEVVRLIAACQDGTAIGLRDEVLIRFGLTGLRATEIGTLTLGNIHTDGRIAWIGKGRKPRTATAGSGLLDAIDRYRALFAEQTGRPMAPADSFLCQKADGAPALTTDRPLRWGQPHGQPRRAIAHLVNARAASAGLGHLSPHDLRRTAAGLLHRSTNEQGMHLFDLLDIQKVLGHADPATTMRSYLDPMDTGVIDRAAAVLDV